MMLIVKNDTLGVNTQGIMQSLGKFKTDEEIQTLVVEIPKKTTDSADAIFQLYLFAEMYNFNFSMDKTAKEIVVTITKKEVE